MKKLQMWNLILTNDAKPNGWSRKLRIPDQLVVKEVVPWALWMPIQKILRPDVI